MLALKLGNMLGNLNQLGSRMMSRALHQWDWMLCECLLVPVMGAS
jgi:hypothetical protein